MPDIRLRVPGFPDIIVITEKQAPVTLKMWLDAGGVPVVPPWQPTFEVQQVITNKDYGPQLLNRDYFATQETATEMMARLQADHTVQVPYSATDSADATTAKAWWLVWKDKTAHIAGTLAAEFRDHPEDREPGVALRNCQKAVDDARKAKETLPTVVV